MYADRLPDTSPHVGRGVGAAVAVRSGATPLVTGMPACVVGFLAPSGSVAELLGGVLLAVVLSIAAAKVGAALWMRHPLARDVLFADLTPREIINKPGGLADEEFDVIKRHPVDGAAMLADVEGDTEIVAIVRSHHERLDGRAYPDGLAGDDIPLGARIIAVADTFDALNSTRSYRPAATHKRALDILRKEAGTQLDRPAVAAFLRTYSGRRPAALSSLVALGPQRLLALTGHQAGAIAGLAPAAGWIAPAAAFIGVSHGTDRTTGQPVPPATTIAAVSSTVAATVDAQVADVTPIVKTLLSPK
jgi:HD domain-containing protein